MRLKTASLVLFFIALAGVFWLAFSGEARPSTTRVVTRDLGPEPTPVSGVAASSSAASSDDDDDPVERVPVRTSRLSKAGKVQQPTATEPPSGPVSFVVGPTPESWSPTPSVRRQPVDPSLDALQELSHLTDDGGEVAARHHGLGIRSGDSSTAPVLPQPTPTPTPTPGLQRVTGQARGYAMLYLLQPEARAGVEREIETMLGSEVQNLYLSALVDGTFGNDTAYLESVVRRLNKDGRTLTLALYLTNGPTQRKYKQTPINAPFVKMSPEDFRSWIRYDRPTRDQFRAIARDARPIFELNRSLNPRNRNIAIVMLEDNLDEPSYLAMRELAEIELGTLVTFVRNPCPGCYPGNDSDGYGDPRELHMTDRIHELKKDDGFTLDGVSFTFPWEPSDSHPRLEEIGSFVDMGMDLGLQYFGLWRAQRQGIGPAGQSVHPRERSYEVQTDQQRQFEIELLRRGLTPVEERAK